jgi:hypothetical protein
MLHTIHTNHTYKSFLYHDRTQGIRSLDRTVRKVDDGSCFYSRLMCSVRLLKTPHTEQIIFTSHKALLMVNQQV